MANTLYGQTLLYWDVMQYSDAIDSIGTPPVGKPIPFDIFSTYFKDMTAPSGIVEIPVPTYPTVSDDQSNGLVTQNINENSYQLAVNKPAGKFFKFNHGEVQQYGLEYFSRINLVPAMYAIDRTLESASFASLSSFNTCSVHPATPTTMSTNYMTQICTQLSVAGINGDRFVVLNSPYYWGLINDLSNKNNQVGADAVRSGTPNNPFGVRVIEAQNFPSSGIVANAVGFAGTKNAIALGTALPIVSHANANEVMAYSSPFTKQTYLFEAYYESYLRSWVAGGSVVWNIATVNPSIQVLTSS